MSGDGFDLSGYVDVKERIRLFYEFFGNGRLVTEQVRLEIGPDQLPRVIVSALAYRTPDDPLPARGWSWMELPGTSGFTKHSELENTETSAWGRAIAALGILVDQSIATRQEVQNKHDDAPDLSQGLIGTAGIGAGVMWDGQLRKTPDGYVLPFKIKEGRHSISTVAEGPLAEALAQLKPTWMDQLVTVWGRWTDETLKVKGVDRSYRLLHLERIQTPDGILPAPGAPAEEAVQPALLP